MIARGVRVLLVDDDPVNRLIVTTVLQRNMHHVVTVENGRDAIACVASQAFAIVLMDLQMSDIDGLEATRAIRRAEHGTGSRIPIVALTARAMKGDREACLAAGMDAYLAKPVQPADLINVVERLGADSPTETQPLEPAEDAVDLGELLSHTDGDRALVAELVTIFQTEAPGMLSDIRCAVEAHDARALESAAHRLRGSVGSFGARLASDAALILEMMGREGALGRAPACLIDLEREIQRVQDALLSHATEGAP